MLYKLTEASGNNIIDMFKQLCILYIVLIHIQVSQNIAKVIPKIGQFLDYFFVRDIPVYDRMVRISEGL